MKKPNKGKRKIILRRAKKRHQRELKRKRKKQREMAAQYHSYAVRRRSKKFVKDKDSVEHVEYVAPSEFSLLTNQKEVLEFLNRAKKKLHQGINVFMNLSKVENATIETITHLCALVHEKGFTRKTALVGNYPTKPELNKIFQNVGFKRILGLQQREISSNDEFGEIISNVSKENIEVRLKVKPRLAVDICNSAVEHTRGLKVSETKIINFPIYKIIIECMANTRNHANFGESESNYNWWLLAYKEPDTKITKFCFADVGVGIFGSLNYKYAHKLLGKTVGNLFSPGDNVKTLKQIFTRGGTTSTKQRKRGRGMQYMYNLVKSEESIENFTLISNDVVATIQHGKGDKINRVDSEFKGTLYYWEFIPKE